MRETLLRPDGRGQTLPDFTVGIAIFLLTVTFISLFVPQIIQPFDDQEQPVVAERITSDLIRSEFVDESGSLAVNETATTSFFARVDTEADVLDTVGIRRSYSLNITLRDGPSQSPNSTILRNDSGRIATTGGEQLRIGPPIPSGQSVSTTRRALFVGDQDVVLEVGVWYDG